MEIESKLNLPARLFRRLEYAKKVLFDIKKGLQNIFFSSKRFTVRAKISISGLYKGLKMEVILLPIDGAET